MGTVAPETKRLSITLQESFNVSGGKSAAYTDATMSTYTLSFLGDDDLEKAYLVKRAEGAKLRLMRLIMAVMNFWILTQLFRNLWFGGLERFAGVATMYCTNIWCLVMTCTSFGRERIGFIGTLALAAVMVSQINSYSWHMQLTQPGNGKLGSVPIPNCVNVSYAGSQFARGYHTDYTPDDAMVNAVNLTRDLEDLVTSPTFFTPPQSTAMRHVCKLVGDHDPMIVEIAHWSERTFDFEQYDFNCVFELMNVFLFGTVGTYLLNLRFVNAQLVSTAPILILSLMYQVNHVNWNYYLSVLWVPFSVLMTVCQPYIRERSDRLLFLRDRRIATLIASKDQRINDQYNSLKVKDKKIGDMDSMLRAAAKVVNSVMEEGGTAIKAYELHSSDIDFGGDDKRTLGEGAFGTVYHATLRGTHEVAVKTMRVGKVCENELRKFKSEIVIMAPLHHPNLVRLFGGVWNEGADKLCIVLEYCANGSLDDFLRRESHREYTWENGLRGVALGVARGLSYLHNDFKEPILHRDVKPANILVSGDEVAKLADFGESRHFDTDGARRNSDDGADALSMTMVGTQIYCAPEVLVGERYNQSADVFSFSLVLLCLVVGDIRYVRNELQGFGRAYIDGWRPPIPAALRGCAGSGLAELIESMWQADFRERPLMRSVVEALSATPTLDSGVANSDFTPGSERSTANGDESDKGGVATMTAERCRLLEDEIPKLRAEIECLQKEKAMLLERLEERR